MSRQPPRRPEPASDIGNLLQDPATHLGDTVEPVEASFDAMARRTP